jgi:membrane protein YdbS with pleckstrin-like domain
MTLQPTTWEQVSPRYQVEVLVETVVGVAGLSLLSSIPLWVALPEVAWLSWYGLVVVGVAFVVLLAFIPRRVRAYGYALRRDDVVFRRGILFQRQVAVPYGRLQLVDVTRGPLSRLLGLSELRLVTAAAATGVTLPGLPLARAEELRDRLISLAETRRAGL